MWSVTEDYCKLVSGIILSTIWREDDHTRLLWITMLAVKGRDHVVRASLPGLAAVANIPIESCRAGLLKLAAPDPDSRTKEHEGRRIAEVDGGWLVLNGEKYRNFLSKQERNEYQAKLMADRRSKSKLAPVSKKLAVLAHTEAEAEAEAEADSGTTTRENLQPTLGMALGWAGEARKLGADYTDKEVTTAFHALNANGWMWGKNPVRDYRSALERQINTDRDRKHENHARTNNRGFDRNKGTFNEGKAYLYKAKPIQLPASKPAVPDVQ